MPSSKEIRGKIKSVENTKKITKAMEMVAASKMRKAQERMRSARPYAEKIGNIASELAKANPEYRHPFLVKVVSTPTCCARPWPSSKNWKLRARRPRSSPLAARAWAS